MHILLLLCIMARLRRVTLPCGRVTAPDKSTLVFEMHTAVGMIVLALSPRPFFCRSR